MKKSMEFFWEDANTRCCFVYDAAAETIRIEPAYWASVSEDAREVCEKWGEHSCGSLREANRIIESKFPELAKRGIKFI